MANVTLVGERWAEVGREFVYLGPNSECRGCNVRTVCFNLREGGRYRIQSLRDTKHPCKVHDSGVVAVEFEELPVQLSLDAGKAMEGAVVTYLGIDCRNNACPHHRVCSQGFIGKNSRVKILSKSDELDCVEGRKLVMVEVEEVNG